MNNKDKRMFMECVESIKTFGYAKNQLAFKRAKANLPQTLFKFRTFEEYNLEAMHKNYIYIAPLNNLDDPFEMILDLKASKYYDFSKKRLKKKAINLLEKEIKKIGYTITPSDIEGTISYKNSETSEHTIFIGKELEYFINYNFVNPKERLSEVISNTGVCALTDKIDNKPMWSLYSDNYKGYCIEYDYSKTNEIIQHLLPVIYTKRRNNNLEEKLFLSLCSNCLDNPFVPYFDKKAALYELYCTKDKDREYQSEWRIVGEPGKWNNILKTKAVYLGFAVTKENEDKMIELAKEKEFKLYKMKKPDQTKKIKFIELL